jgi:hypothetical protein
MAVVVHRQRHQAALLQRDGDLARAGVQRVLDQLLDDGGRPLDDLARGDAVDGRAVQHPDLARIACHAALHAGPVG